MFIASFWGTITIKLFQNIVKSEKCVLYVYYNFVIKKTKEK